MELVAGIALGLLVGICIGFWVGFSFIKDQLPKLPKPEVKVENINTINVPKSPVISDRKPLEVERDNMAEFVSGL